MLDALHTNQQTLREIVQGTGADYLLPVKDNHEGLKSRVEKAVTNPSSSPPRATQAARNHSRPGTPDVFSPCGHEPGAAPVRYRRERGKNRGRHEKRSLRWVSTTPESLCCVTAHSVLEITREVNFLR